MWITTENTMLKWSQVPPKQKRDIINFGLLKKIQSSSSLESSVMKRENNSENNTFSATQGIWYKNTTDQLPHQNVQCIINWWEADRHTTHAVTQDTIQVNCKTRNPWGIISNNYIMPKWLYSVVML